MRRATSLAASWPLRAIFLNEVFTQQRSFIEHVGQSVCRDRKMMVLAFVTCERWFLKARHLPRNACPVGQRYFFRLFIPLKVAAREAFVLALGFLPNRHMSFSSTIQAGIGAVP